MTLNDVTQNRVAFDTVEAALFADRRKWLLHRLGSKAQGLRCWAFGSGWETRSVSEISDSKIREFSQKYA
jgi:hypothetical protein